MADLPESSTEKDVPDLRSPFAGMPVSGMVNPIEILHSGDPHQDLLIIPSTTYGVPEIFGTGLSKISHSSSPGK